MNREQHLLIKFDEECSEAVEEISDLIILLSAIQKHLAVSGQRATKALRFTLEEAQPGQPLTNGARLYEEIVDINTAISLLVERKIIPPPPTDGPDIEKRKIKFEKYLIHSTTVGTFE